MPLTTRKISIIAFAFATAMTATGCSNNDPGAEPPPKSTTTIVTPTPTLSTKTPSEEPTNNESPTPSTTVSTDTSSSEPTSVIVKPDPDGGPKDLTLADAFNPSSGSDVFSSSSGWVEDKFDIASEKGIRGIALKDFPCNKEDELEFRLANDFSKLSFSFGQSNDSADSEMELKVAVYGNGEQLKSDSVPFNKIKPMNVKVESVNALKIKISATRKEECYSNKKITPVLYDIEVK